MGTEPQELQTVTAAEIEAAWAAVLGEGELPAIQDPEIVSRQIIDRIRKAETFEDALATQSLPAWREMLGVPVFVHYVRLQRSGFEGQYVYAVCDITTAADGEPHTVTCGGKNVLAQLLTMLEHGWLDKPVKMVDKETGEGYRVLWLEAA